MATLTYRQVYDLARSVGLSHDRAVMATAIAKGESGLRTDATGDTSLTDSTWGPSLGLWQVRSLNDENGTGKTRDATRLHDPAFNARSMFAISSGGTNWSPWTIYTSGAYRQYLDDVAAAVGDASDNPPGGVLPIGAFADLPGDWDIPDSLDPREAAGSAAKEVVEWLAKPMLIATIVAAGFAVIGVGLWAASGSGGSS